MYILYIIHYIHVMYAISTLYLYTCMLTYLASMHCWGQRRPGPYEQRNALVAPGAVWGVV